MKASPSLATSAPHLAPLGRAVAAIMLCALAAPFADAQAEPPHWKYSPTPLVGWNSWDIFGGEFETQGGTNEIATVLKITTKN